MRLHERLLTYKTEQRYTYRALAGFLDTTLIFVHDFCKNKIKRVDADLALKIDRFLTERGY